VHPEGSEVCFYTNIKGSHSPPGQSCTIDADLQSRFSIAIAATAGFHGDLCSGRIFMLDRTIWAEEDIPLVKIVAERVGIELEDRILRRQLEEGAITRERVRLGRDLHDGVLQSLAAANIQLKVLADQLPANFTNRVNTIRGALADEAHRIRDFVEGSRSIGACSPEVISIGPELRKRCEALGVQWGCAVNVIIEPPELLTSAGTARHLDHIIGESVSNAVRHGRATHVSVSLAEKAEQLELCIRDDGTGFGVNQAGRHNPAQQVPPRPLSLRSRVEELGGKLMILPSAKGADIRVELPI
jgi:signal transduction histidine kinase